MAEVAEVSVKSAWLSKINLGELVKMLLPLIVALGVNIPPELQTQIILLVTTLGGIYTIVMKTFFTTSVTPSSAAKL